MKKQNKDSEAVIIDGVRTPFVRSHNAFVNFSSYELGRIALKGLVSKTGIDPNVIDHVAMGTVIHDPRTSNVARECVLGADFPKTTPANTVALACISANVAATQVADMIETQNIDAAIFGGVDTCSDPPIRVSQKLRKLLVKFERVKGPKDLVSKMRYLKGFKLKDLLPEIPQVAEFSNGKTMGQGAELLAQQAGVTREQADLYAEHSHQRAIVAQKEGIFREHILDVSVPPKCQHIFQDDGPRADTTAEKLTRLRPAFDKNFGICTAGNSSFLTDGASAVLVSSRKKAKQMGWQPKAVIRDYVYVAGDPLHEMLSGPALSIPKLLQRNKLSLEDIDVFEIHEAFAAQMVANLNLLKSKTFCKDRLGLSKACGEIPFEKLNIWGGSLSIGHPFGATGGRLLYTAARRLELSKARYAIVSGCAAGGHGSAILLENVQS